ncbi:MAG TPA: tRNA lysidine(34) synthetase TilS [Gammaproteobacteria bacterium]|nr:tRNA lysidine(34) synthetase TilS [Gammaproteobacteria bacterium]
MVKFNPDHIVDALLKRPAAERYWVAFSGGLDSTVLLHALAMRRDRLPGALFAIHVHHGLQEAADRWLQHCEDTCRKLKVTLTLRNIEIHAEAGQSLEAVAREERYAAFRNILQTGESLLLAHHLDDQLETFLLQALRGSGVAGLAAMPAFAPFAGGYLARPLLEVPRDSLLDWARAQKLTWVDDPSNQDLRFDRNYLRHEVVPRLKQRWPAAAETISRSARHCGEAMELLNVQAAEDLRRYIAAGDNSLALQAVRTLSRPRAKHLIRHWLAQSRLSAPPTHKLDQVFSDILNARPDRIPCVRWADVELRRYRDRLYAQNMPVPVPVPFILRPGEFRDLGPGLGRLGLVPDSTGIAASACPASGLEVAFRMGGERVQPQGKPHSRALKKWLQEYDVLPWWRAYLPILHRGGEILAVGGLFCCEPHCARGGEPALRLVWEGAPRVVSDTKKVTDFQG